MKYLEVTIEFNSGDPDLPEILAAELMDGGVDSVEIIDPAGIRELLWDTDPTEYVDAEEFAAGLPARPALRFYLEPDFMDRPVSGYGPEPKSESKFELQKLCDGALSREAAIELIYALCGYEHVLGTDLADLTNLADLTDGIASGIAGASVTMVDDVDWKDKWKEYFVPTRLTDRIWVRPGWRELPPGEAEIEIEIDPGMAFGTGTHETTYLTLRLMEKYIDIDTHRVMDVGCGSGILSIAAAKLGAGEVLGIDIDPEAVRVSNENFEKNGVADAARAELGNLLGGKAPAGAYEMVVANMLTDILLELNKTIAGYIKPGGIYILSGILDKYRSLISDDLTERGFAVLEMISEGGWTAIAARR